MPTREKGVRDLRRPCAVCWEGFPLLNVNKHVDTLWTTEHQCGGKWGFYLSKATLKYIEDFISPFWWGGVLFATVLSRCLRHAAFARNTRGCKLEPSPLVSWLGAPCLSRPARMSRWCARPQVFHCERCCITRAYVCTCVILTPPPDEAVLFPSLLTSLAVATSAAGTTGWWRATCLSPALSAQLIVIDFGTALTFLEYRAVLTSPARPLFSRTSCRETGWIEQRCTIASLTSEPLSHSQNKCKKFARVSSGSSS